MTVVKVEPKPQDAKYRVYYDAERYSSGDDYEVNPRAQYGVSEPAKVPSRQTHQHQVEADRNGREMRAEKAS